MIAPRNEYAKNRAKVENEDFNLDTIDKFADKYDKDSARLRELAGELSLKNIDMHALGIEADVVKNAGQYGLDGAILFADYCTRALVEKDELKILGIASHLGVKRDELLDIYDKVLDKIGVEGTGIIEDHVKYI